MSDRMYPLSFAKLMDRLLAEYVSQGSIFGVTDFYQAAPTVYSPWCGGHMETPLGPAAGPHTQLAQNIIAAYAAGARFFELKTVQVLDGEDLPVSKPCILSGDECYNVEWSTELTVDQALAEYVKAWFALKLISREFSLGASDGFIFNMSVGYDLAGISSTKVDGFIEGLKQGEALPIWQQCCDWALANLRRFRQVDAAFIYNLESRICNSVTLSTLHGCPPREIERIAAYLLTEKGLHTYIKCNPTLLGYDFVRGTMDQLGFRDMHFDDRHFREDLQFADAVPLLKRLQKLAEQRGLQLGVKLSNTLPVAICGGELPGEEMYLSGRALYPLTITLAAQLAEEFKGQLAISYCGGAELYNIKALLDAGLRPVTLASALLKPGGYQRLRQLAVTAVDTILPVTGLTPPVPPALDARAVRALSIAALQGKRYGKLPQTRSLHKLPGAPAVADCFVAPCQEACP
ncbi:MAG: putative selenate reductase subunit YgfK, partial [Clostridiales bacterium]